MTAQVCKEPGCNIANWARGFCSRHYQQHRRNGDFFDSPYNDSPLVPATATRRLLQDLSLRGYQLRELAKELSTTAANLHYVRSGRSERVRGRFEDEVCDLYDTLSTGFGDSLETMEVARGRGYLPASRYVDITDEKSGLHKTTALETLLDVSFFRAQGEEFWFIAERLGTGERKLRELAKNNGVR